jgi:YggT family protein
VIKAALIFLASTVLGLFTVALLLRFHLQLVRAAYRNPLSEFLNALTDFAVLRARRVIPGLWGLDFATLVLAWFVQCLDLLIVLYLKDYELGTAVGAAAAGIALLALVNLVKFALYMVMVAVLVQAVMSWINPYSPLAPLLRTVTRPFLQIFRRFIPPIGNVDLSPLAAIIVCQLLLMVPVAYLETTLLQMF